MPSPLDDVRRACLAAEALPRLAPLRTRPDVRVALRDGRAWVEWAGECEAVLTCLLPVPGVELFVRRGECWHRLGARLPAFDVPDLADARALGAVLHPAPVNPLPPPSSFPEPGLLGLVRDGRPRRASALLAPREAVLRWAGAVPAAAFAGLTAARLEEIVLLRGEHLPPLVGATRYWGDRVLTPLGFRPEPAWPEAALADALDLGPEETALLGQEDVTVVPGGVLRPLDRARARLLAAAPVGGGVP